MGQQETSQPFQALGRRGTLRLQAPANLYEGKSMFRTFAIAATTAATQFSSVAFTHEASQGTPSIPDFSGMWSYPYWPSFELPLSGPGPVVNKLRLRQRLDADGRLLTAANAPLAGNPIRLVGDYTN